MKTNLIDAIHTRVLLGDGAMGTQLQQAGLEPGGCGEAWNADAPDRVAAIQQRYADAGSDCLITNTFGANRITLARHEMQTRARELNRAGAEIARRVMGFDRFVLGDIGPSGTILEPLGDMPYEQLFEAFREQAEGLAEGGVDAIIIETMTALDELECAIAAAKTTGLPVIGSLAFDKVKSGAFHTMMGTTPEQAVDAMVSAGVDIVAANCGTGIDINDYAAIVAAYRARTTKPIMAQPNAGMPELEDDTVTYRETPEMMAEGVWGLVRAGANIIGGCCGTTPEHIRLFRRELDKL
jgi:5-methyltetrahydrofolate--homocysteine methyltransferase